MISVGPGGPGNGSPARIAAHCAGSGNDVMVPQLGPVGRASGRARNVPGAGSVQAPGAAGAHRRQRGSWLERRRPMAIVVDHHLHGLLMLERPEQALEIARSVQRLDPDVAALDADHLVGHADQPLDVADLGLFRAA